MTDNESVVYFINNLNIKGEQSWRKDALGMALGNCLLLFWHFVYTLLYTIRMKLELISE